MKPQRATIKRLLRLLGPVLLVVLLVKLDARRIVTQLAGAALLPLGGALVLNIAAIHLKVVRWQLLLRTQGVNYPLGRAWLALLSTSYVGVLTPGRVGDVLRIQFLRHEKDVPYAEGLASIVMDRFCDFYVLAAFVAMGAVRFGSVLVGNLAYLTWGLVVCTTLIPALFFVPGLAERGLGSFYARVYAKASRGSDASGFQVFLRTLRMHAGAGLIKTIPVTVAAFLVNYAQGWLVARALGLQISFYDVACLLGIASLIGLLPISISGLGVREAFFALAFPVLGYAPSLGVAYGLVVFAVIYVVLVVAGFAAWQLAPPPFSADLNLGSKPSRP